MNGTLEAISVLIILLTFSVISFKRNLLDRDGIIIANIMGLAIYLLDGIGSFLTVLLFFIIAELATKVGRGAIGSKHERRTVGNIVGNGMPALIALTLGSNIAFYGAIAAALSDTLSSEIGLLSKRKPRLIINLKEVEPGTDGGVTILGFLAGLVGAFFIASIGVFVCKEIFIAIIITISGFIGCIVDSILGATFEIKGRLNNTQVNFLGSSSGAILAYLLAILL